MELNFDNVKSNITASEILNHISEFDIFKYYCHNFKEIDKSFKSEFRSTDTDNCRIFFTRICTYHNIRLRLF